MTGNRLIAIDAATGSRPRASGRRRSVAVGVSYGGTPTIYRNVAIIGAATQEMPQGPPGNPRAFDVVTGKKLWEFWTVAQPGPGTRSGTTTPRGERLAESLGREHVGRSTRRSMSSAASSICRSRSPATNYYGGDRPGNNAYGNSIVAVDAQTGKYLWHFQTVHHDIWDIDMPSAGALFDFVQGGKRTPAIAHVGQVELCLRARSRDAASRSSRWRSGRCRRATCRPSGIRRRSRSRCGPVRSSRVSFNTDTDLVRPEDTTPEHVAACTAMMEKAGGYYNAGPFTPFMFKELDAPPKSTIQLPGGTGGVNWGGMAMDPTTRCVLRQRAEHDAGRLGRAVVRCRHSSEAPNGRTHRVDFAGESASGPFFTYRGSVRGKSNATRSGPSSHSRRR